MKNEQGQINTMYSNKENVNILTALLVAHGIRDIVVCPGSRNAPLVHNFNECGDIRCHAVTDERSAGFIALGLRLQQQSPVAVCVTSGSALLNVLPAAAEATYQHTGIIVISADRPRAWIGQLDGQTLPQQEALGRFVAESVTLPEPHDDTERWHCNRLVNEALLANKQMNHPSVHINVPISEPLFEFAVATLPSERVVSSIDSKEPEADKSILQLLEESTRPMIVLGQMDKYTAMMAGKLRKKLTVLSEPLSSDEHVLTDQILYVLASERNADDYKPDCVIYLGGHTVSKRLRQYLRACSEARHVMVTEDYRLHDVSQHTSVLIYGRDIDVIKTIAEGYTETEASKAYRRQWEMLQEKVKQQHYAYEPEYSQMLAVREFEKHMQEEKAHIYYANSMSVRLACIYADHYCYCNRGLNGIEGSLSVAVGASLARKEEKVYCVIGDLSFLYDQNALWQQQTGGNLRILLLNNSQGGIFRNLRGLDKSTARDTLVSARHNVDSVEGTCRQYGVTYLRATDAETLAEGLQKLCGMESRCPVLLEVKTDVDKDEQVFKSYYHKFRI